MEINGAEKTGRKTILKVSGLSEGMILKEEEIKNALSSAEKKLLNTENFSEVKIERTVYNENLIIKINLKEKLTLIPYIVPYYSSESGFSASGGVVDTNFLGLNKILILSAKTGSDENQFFLKYIDNSFFNTGSLFEADFEYSLKNEYLDTENYEKLELLRLEGEYLYPVFKNFYTGIYGEQIRSLNDKIYNPDPSYILSPSFYYNNLQKINYSRKGSEFRLRPGFMNTTGNNADFYLYSEERIYLNLSDIPGAENSYTALRGSVFYSPGRTFSFTSTDNLRGVSEGEVRGKTGYALNTEYRHFLAKLNKPVSLYVFLPFFYDTGILADSMENIDISDSFSSCGTGIIFYPENISVLIRFNIGIEVSSYREKDNSSFFSVSFGREMY